MQAVPGAPRQVAHETKHRVRPADGCTSRGSAVAPSAAAVAVAAAAEGAEVLPAVMLTLAEHGPTADRTAAEPAASPDVGRSAEALLEFAGAEDEAAAVVADEVAADVADD